MRPGEHALDVAAARELWLAQLESAQLGADGLGAGAQLGDHRVGVVGGVDRGAGHEHVRPRLGAALDGLQGDTAVDLQPGLDAVPVHHLDRARRILGRQRSRNFWPPKPGSTVMISSMSSSASRSS